MKCKLEERDVGREKPLWVVCPAMQDGKRPSFQGPWGLPGLPFRGALQGVEDKASMHRITLESLVSFCI